MSRKPEPVPDDQWAPVPYLGGPVPWEGGPDHVPPWVKKQGRLMREHDAKAFELAQRYAPLSWAEIWPGLDEATKARIRSDYWDGEAEAWKPGTPNEIRDEETRPTLDG